MMELGRGIRGCARVFTLAALVCATGCSGSRGVLTGWMPWSRSSEESAIQEMMASQQQNARKVKTGKESSIYPPEIVQQEPLPKTEEDLKNPMQLHLSYAKLQEQLGHLTEARASYEKVVAKEPKSVEAIIGLGRLDMLAGRHQQAEERFRQAVEMSQSSPESLFALGQFMASRQRYTEAIVEMQKAVRIAPRNAQFKYELGLTLARAGQYDDSLRVLADTVSEAEANYNLGYILLKEQNNPVLAEQYLNRALQLDPELKHARYWLTQIKANNSTIATVAGTAQENGSVVVNAVAAQAASHRESQFLRQAHVPAEPAPENLTPEQWEQWKNQAQRQ